MEKEKNRSLNALKVERWRKEKEAKKKEADRDYYRRNRDCKIVKVQEGRRKLQKKTPVETRQVMKARAHKTKGAQGKKEEREMAKQKQDKIRQQTRDRVRKLREKRKKTVQDNTAANLGDGSAGLSTCTPLSKSPFAFRNRMARKRALKNTKDSLPKTREKG